MTKPKKLKLSELRPGIRFRFERDSENIYIAYDRQTEPAADWAALAVPSYLKKKPSVLNPKDTDLVIPKGTEVILRIPPIVSNYSVMSFLIRDPDNPDTLLVVGTYWSMFKRETRPMA